MKSMINMTLKFLLAVSILLLPLSAFAEKLTIVAASDLKFAFRDIVESFKKENPSDDVDVIFGSSGKFYTQIQNGAPFDLFFSADSDYPNKLKQSGMTASEVTLYGLGRIVLWSNQEDATRLTLTDLARADIKHVAIANPKHAPYGKRAEEALMASGMLESIKSKLVFAENIAQTAQYVETGNAKIGIIAYSLALSTELSAKGGYYLIPESLHAPLEQSFVITKRAEQNSAAHRFAAYMQTETVKTLMHRYGFVLPER